MNSESQLAQNYVAPRHVFHDRVILVTGAGDGIGRAAAQSLAEHGATVILAGRTVPKLEQVYDRITGAGWPQPAIYPVDLLGANEQDYEELAASIATLFGRLDGLLHNAGELGQRAPLANYSAATWQKVLQVNVTAGFLLSRALLPLLEKSEDGAILFTSSSVGRRGQAYWGAYAVSKFATEGLAQVLAEELEETTRIRVNCINPGATRTRMRAAAYPAENPARVKTPEEIMPAYLYLLGPASKGISGISIDAQ